MNADAGCQRATLMRSSQTRAYDRHEAQEADYAAIVGITRCTDRNRLGVLLSKTGHTISSAQESRPSLSRCKFRFPFRDHRPARADGCKHTLIGYDCISKYMYITSQVCFRLFLPITVCVESARLTTTVHPKHAFGNHSTSVARYVWRCIA